MARYNWSVDADLLKRIKIQAVNDDMEIAKFLSLAAELWLSFKESGSTINDVYDHIPMNGQGHKIMSLIAKEQGWE